MMLPPLARGRHRVLIYRDDRIMTWAEDASFAVAWRTARSAVRALGRDERQPAGVLEVPRGRARYSCGRFAAVPERRCR